MAKDRVIRERVRQAHALPRKGEVVGRVRDLCRDIKRELNRLKDVDELGECGDVVAELTDYAQDRYDREWDAWDA